MPTYWNKYTPPAGESPWAFMTTGPGQNLTDPFATALPSGADVTKQATATTSDWLKGLQNLWSSTNQGRNLFAAYNAPSWSDPGYRREMATRRQYLADDAGQRAREIARRATMLGQMRGGYGVRGGGGSTGAANLAAAYQGMGGDRQAQLRQLYADYIGEREAARQGAIAGYSGLLGGIGTGLGAYNTAAANQAAALAQAAQNQLAERNMILGLYQAGLNYPSAEQRRLADPYGYAHKAALQAAMDKEAAAQNLYRAQVEAGMGMLQGNRLTDASRGQQFAAQKAYENALIAAGVATPVSRSQNMNQIMGAAGSGSPQVFQSAPRTSGYGGQNIPQMYYNPNPLAYYYPGYY